MLYLESDVFTNGGKIPRKYGYHLDNVNPPLKIKGIPEKTESLVLIMDDPDAIGAVGKVWVHWILWNINPNITSIKEGIIPPGSIEGKTDFNEIGYGGPAPPDKEHTYIFKLYALNTKINLKRGSSNSQVEESIKNHIIAEAQLHGTYSP